MNCFNHPLKPALGICKSCGKGLCGDCLSVVPDGLACRDACEERVRMINAIIDSNQKAMSSANANLRASAWFITTLGIVFSLVGFVPLLVGGPRSVVPMGVMGVVFLAYGLTRLRRSQLYPVVRRDG